MNQSDVAEGLKKKAELMSSWGTPSAEIAELFVGASNMYRGEEKYLEAADCSEKAYAIYHKLRNAKSVGCLTAAAKCMRSANRFEDYVRYMKRASMGCLELGQTLAAARHLQAIGHEFFVQEQYEIALEFYLQAADILSKSRDRIEYLSQLQEVIAECYCLTDNFQQAAESYMKVVEMYMVPNAPLTQFFAASCLLKSGMCALCCDEATAQKFLDKFEDLKIFPSFKATEEGQFLHMLLRACKRKDPRLYNTAIKRNTTQSAWQTKLLLIIRQSIVKTRNVVS